MRVYVSCGETEAVVKRCVRVLWTVQNRIVGWGRVVDGWYSSVQGGGFGGC